jgi:acetyltransferase-like isoleucine patch superfamily enzyme
MSMTRPTAFSRFLAADKLNVARQVLALVRGYLWRAWVLAINRNAKIGKGLRCYQWPRLAYGSGHIQLGDNVRLSDVMVSVAPNARFVMGDRSSINEGGYVVVSQEVRIGSDVLIAELVSIRDADHAFERTDLRINQQGLVGAPILIEDGVWIARGVAVLSGVRIGHGAVIGANAVVTKAIPAMAVAVGVPARVVRSRIAAQTEARTPSQAE